MDPAFRFAGIHVQRLLRCVAGEPGAGEHPQLLPPGRRRILRFHSPKRPDPAPASQYEGGGKFRCRIVAGSAARQLRDDALGQKPSLDGAAGTASAQEGAGTSLGETRIADRAGPDEGRYNSFNGRVRRRDHRFGSVMVRLRPRPSINPLYQHAAQTRLGCGVAGEVGQRRLLQVGSIGRRKLGYGSFRRRASGRR